MFDKVARQVISDFVNDGWDERYLIELHSAPDMDQVFIEGDHALLVRMLRNIIGNSIEHNPNGCDIKVFVEVGQTACVFVLQDTGCGVDEALLLRLNAEDTEQITQNEQGEIVHGNGVKLVRQIVAAHDGTIHFTNIEPHGLAITIELPMNKLTSKVTAL